MKGREENKSVYVTHALERRHVTMLSVGYVIGGSLFIGSGDLLALSGPSLVLTFLLAAFVAIVVNFSIIHMSRLGPDGASIQDQAGVAYGGLAASLTNGAILLGVSMGSPAEIIAASIVLHSFFPHIPIHWFCLGVGAFVSILSLLTKEKRFGRLEPLTAFLKIFILLTFSVVGICVLFDVMPTGTESDYWASYRSTAFFPNGGASMMGSFAAVVMMFGGVENIALYAERSQDPRHNLQASSLSVSLRVAVIYVLSIFILTVAVPVEQAKADVTPFATAIRLLEGEEPLALLFKALVLIFVVTCAMGGVFLVSQVLNGQSPQADTARQAGQNRNRFGASLLPLLSAPLTICFGENVYLFLIYLSGFGFMCTWLFVLLSRFRYGQRVSPEGGAEMRWGSRVVQSAAVAILLAGFVFMGATVMGAMALLLGCAFLLLVAVLYGRKHRRKTK